MRVKAAPFVGRIARDHDVVDGRFALHVGGMRTEPLSQKIPWFLPRRYRSLGVLFVTGTRLDAPGRFTQRFSVAASAADPGQRVYPSNIAPPVAGCWRLAFRSGVARGSLVALVRG